MTNEKPTHNRQGIPYADPSTYELEFYPAQPEDQKPPTITDEPTISVKRILSQHEISMARVSANIQIMAGLSAANELGRSGATVTRFEVASEGEEWSITIFGVKSAPDRAPTLESVEKRIRTDAAEAIGSLRPLTIFELAVLQGYIEKLRSGRGE